MKDKAYTYPHNNPEIEGSMAVYSEPKPKYEDFDHVFYRFIRSGDHPELHQKEAYEIAVNEWQSESRIGYIKEVFKEKQEVYYNSILVTITCKREDNKWLVCDRSNPIRHESFLVDEEDISHYYPGQKVDLKDFRWVEKVKKSGTVQLEEIKL